MMALSLSKKVVAQYSTSGLRKSASLPQVGLIDNEDRTPARLVAEANQEDDFSALSSAFGTRKGSF